MSRLTTAAARAISAPAALRAHYSALTTGDHWSLLRYAVTIGWAIAFLTWTPTSLLPFLGGLTTALLMGFAIIGSLAGIVGRLINQHLVLELPGAVLASVTLLFYLFVNIVLAFAVTTDRAALCWVIVLALSFPLERAVGLGRRLYVVLKTPEDRL